MFIMDYSIWILCIVTFLINITFKTKGYHQISRVDSARHYPAPEKLLSTNTTGKYSSNCSMSITLHPQTHFTIHSPNFPYSYPPKSFCVWKFQAPFIGRIVLNFTHFILQTGTSAFTCDRDYLDIADWTGSTRFCSLGPPHRVVNITSTWMEMTFVSDEIWQYPGFQANIQFIPSFCGSNLSSTSGVFESPNYPFSYPSNSICGWVIQVSSNRRIRLDCTGLFYLTDFSRHCHDGFLSISRTGDITMKDAQTSCRMDGPGVIYSVRNRLVAIFRSSNSNSGIGFRCRYTSVFREENNSMENYLTPCKCGKAPQRKPRIIGGSPALISEYPWMAIITDVAGKHLCNGVFVGPQFVLTAGHCVYGVEDMNKTVEFRHSLLAERILIYPSYERQYQDLALIKIETANNRGRNIQPICFPPLNATFENKTAIVIGWNHGVSGNSIKYQLHQVAVPVLPPSVCKQSYGDQTFDVNQMICAGSPGKDACEGDSGGPLMLHSGTTWHVIGIVSFGLGCGLPGFPGVYVRVSHFLTWLIEKTGNNTCY